MSGATDERRQRILDAAASVLARNPGASLAEVASEAGVGRTTVHRAFPARADLLAALAFDALARAEQAIEQARPTEGSAAAALGRVAAAVLPLAARFRYLELGPQVWDLPEVQERWDRLSATLDTIVERGKRTGEFHPELPTALVTEVLAGAVWGLGEAIEDGRVARADAVPGLMEVLLGGIRRDESRP